MGFTGPGDGETVVIFVDGCIVTVEGAGSVEEATMTMNAKFTAHTSWTSVEGGIFSRNV